MSILVASDIGDVGVLQNPGPLAQSSTQTPDPEIGAKKLKEDAGEGRAVTGLAATSCP